MGNQIRATFMLAGMTVLFIWVGRMLGGQNGMVLAFFLAAAMNFFSYWFSDRLVLGMYRAKEADPQTAPELYGLVESIARKAGLPTPRVYIIPQEGPNAFATGRNPEHAAIAVTEGLLNFMGREELKGVLAHEMGHIKNRDILIGSIAATMAGAVMMLASMARWSALFGGFRRDEEGEGLGGVGLLILSILAPIGAMIIQMAISRSREYQADATAANLTGSPAGLASALAKLGAYSRRIPLGAEPATAHMFIVNPLSGKSLMSLFSTHPPIEERIAALTGARPPIQGDPPAHGGEDRRMAEGKAFWDRLSR